MSDEPIEVKLPPIPNLELSPEFGDPSQLFAMRRWLEDACKNRGAKVTGGGIGMGSADIDIELEGHSYYLIIKPILR